MALLLSCNNKGCGKSNVVAGLDLETKKVYCPECDGEITGISSFTISQLKNLKQIRKPKKEAFGVVCATCKHHALPLLLENKLVCPKCKQLHQNIPIAFQSLIREKIKQKISEENE